MDILLAKPKLPEGWLDCSVGEPHLVRQNLIETFKLSQEISVPNLVLDDMVYPDHTGYKKLVDFLEKKHGAPVVITNGAKQALGACFYSLKKMGHDEYAMRTPYWALIPPLAKQHGLHFRNSANIPYLCLAPNNPDGHTQSPEELVKLAESYKTVNLPFIHDAAYYTYSYIERSSHSLPSVGDVQIYSISKMLGLSGLRLGYVVCPNQEFYKFIQDYMETMTVGVSMVPQVWLYNFFHNHQPNLDRLMAKFEDKNFYELVENKKILKTIDTEILEVPNDFEYHPGMFGWFKVGPKAKLEKSRINFIKGDLFGMPGFIRMNLAFNFETMKEIVNRINEAK
jgi:aspartate/methionine/tyrosine aminotransferase